MPHHVDFSLLDNDIEKCQISCIGWKNPITLEYTYVIIDDDSYLYWRVFGTTHTFTISVNELNRMSKGNITEHFQQALTVFRDDIINWAASGCKESWQREYIYIFTKFLNI